MLRIYPVVLETLTALVSKNRGRRPKHHPTWPTPAPSPTRPHALPPATPAHPLPLHSPALAPASAPATGCPGAGRREPIEGGLGYEPLAIGNRAAYHT